MALQIAPRKIPNPQAYQALHAVSVQRDLSDLVSCDSLPTPFAHLYPLISLLFLEYAALEPAQVLCLLPEMLFFRCSLVPPLYLLWVFVPMLLSQETHPDNLISFS